MASNKPINSIRIPGEINSVSNGKNESEFIEITQSFEIIGRKRDAKAVIQNVNTTGKEIVCLKFKDGGEWISTIPELEEIFGKSLINDKGVLELPDSMTAVNIPANRGGSADEFKLDVLEFVKSKLTGKLKKKGINEMTYELGLMTDKYCMPDPGFFRVKGGDLIPFTEEIKTPQHYLLFLHGTISSFDGSFSGLFEDQNNIGVPELISSKYGKNVLALQHYTLTESPFKNAIQVLEELPEGCTLDIISHSRGGIIADILATCDRINLESNIEAYTMAQIASAKTFDQNSPLAKELGKLNQLAKEKKIEVKQIIRVACPAAGTVILDNSFEKFLNAILNAIGLFPAVKAFAPYQFIKSVIVAIKEIKGQAVYLPGLLSMIPGSFPQKLINRSDITLKSKLAVIEGDAEFGGGFGHSSLVILTNILFRTENDFVVNTKSMSRGMLREDGVQIYTSRDNQTSHITYFKNKNTQQALANALQVKTDKIKEFTTVANEDLASRGVIVGLFKKYRKFKSDPTTGNKPIIILIPGIMGTQLSVDGNIIWADLIEIGRGRMFELDPGKHPVVGTDYVIGQYYADLTEYLSGEYDVITFGYDWRQSLSLAANLLKEKINSLSKLGQPIRIIAHSMGGLVVRDMMRLYKNEWNQFINKKDSKLILLGTPWRGSHLIVEAFTGHLKVVRQINLMDLGHSQQQLLDLYHSFEGMYQLLPLTEDWESKSKWESLKVELLNEKFNVPKLLKNFTLYKDEVNDWLPSADLKNVVYIAGKSDSTTCAYEVINNKLKFFGTPEGDGSVTWELGIPKTIKPEQVYYAYDTIHGDLACDNRLFDGIKELLIDNKVSIGNNLFNQPPSTLAQRGTKTIKDYEGLVPVEYEPVSNRADEAWNNLINRPNKESKRSTGQDPISVSVVHCDLKYASYAVMAGHIGREAITGSEKALDNYYEGKLMERNQIGNYPARVGESLILFDPDKDPCGAIIVGLGEIDQFNAYNLRKTVELGIVNYAMYMRDNVNNKWLEDETNAKHDRLTIESSISCLCIGTGYGKIPMDEALRAILTGIQKANEVIRKLNNQLRPIERVEFVEQYEHIALNMHYQLSAIKERADNKINITLKKEIEQKYGARKKFQFSNDDAWWHNFSTQHDESNKIHKIQFISSSGIARVEQENTFTSMDEVDSLLAEMALYKNWNSTDAKTLFELLIPYNLKDIIRQQNNIVWKMDIDTASIPWEMFHDKDQDLEPTFINSGLIRQLITPNARYRPTVIRSNSALVIGNPDYSGTDLPDLPGAKEEADLVNQLLVKNNFNTTPLTNKEKKLEILSHLTNEAFKILHVAGHGQVEDGKTGIVLNNGFVLTPDKFKNFSHIPEFAFINCCSLGEIKPKQEKYYENRYKFAANIGTELINLGVNAVIVAGWPVNDASAKKFAEVVYTNLLDGVQFGLAVQRARKAAYTEANNTWGAYQCYGDPWYQLTNQKSKSRLNGEYAAKDEVMADLYNILSSVRLPNSNRKDLDAIKQNLKDTIVRADQYGFYDSTTKEKEAEIFSELDDLHTAIDRYDSLRTTNKADYSIRSIEQFYNLKAKYLLRTLRDKSRKWGKDVIEEEMQTIENSLLSLISFGKTPERYSILASAYKKLGSIRNLSRGLSDSIPSKLNYLSKAREYYLKAYKHKGLTKLSGQVYPLSNFLALHAILGGGASYDLDKKKEPIKSFLDKKIKDLQGSFTRHKEFWDDISLINLLQAKLYYTPISQLKNATNAILVLYESTQKEGGFTPKNLQTEIEQAEFMLDFQSKNESKDWNDAFKENINKVKSTLEGYRV